MQDAEEIFLVASCYGNRDKLRPDWPLRLNADVLLQNAIFLVVFKGRLKGTQALRKNGLFSETWLSKRDSNAGNDHCIIPINNYSPKAK